MKAFSKKFAYFSQVCALKDLYPYRDCLLFTEKPTMFRDLISQPKPIRRIKKREKGIEDAIYTLTTTTNTIIGEQRKRL